MELRLLVDGAQRWSASQHAMLRIRITGIDGELHTIPALELQGRDERDTYWAPLHLERGRSLAANSTALLTPEGTNRELSVDPQDLMWGRSIQGGWPEQALFEVVPPGVYRLQLKVEVMSSAGGDRRRVAAYRSNTVTVRVQKK
jgi:hypothetical protein